MNITEWAKKWRIPDEAIDDFRAQTKLTDTSPPSDTPRGEGEQQNRVRLEASKKGCILWRNNLGACLTDTGTFIRYGLANDSRAMNNRVKSSDLIGIMPVKITQGHVGSTLGVFLAREMKAEGWKYSGNSRERAQLAYLELVMAYGGDAAFATGEGTI